MSIIIGVDGQPSKASEPASIPAPAAAIPPVLPTPSKEDVAHQLIRRNMLWATGAGVIPFPVVDILGITAVQLKLINSLSDLYKVPFSEHRAKNIIASLLGGAGAVAVGGGVVASLLKFIPVVGQAAGIVSVPATAAAITYAVGKVFVQHFEAGGTLLDFNAARSREYFRKEFEEAKAREIRAATIAAAAEAANKNAAEAAKKHA